MCVRARAGIVSFFSKKKVSARRASSIKIRIILPGANLALLPTSPHLRHIHYARV